MTRPPSTDTSDVSAAPPAPPPEAAASASVPERPPSSEEGGRRRRDLLSHRSAGPHRTQGTWLTWAAAGWLALVGLSALLASALPIADPSELIGDPRLPPFRNWSEPLGTDYVGRSQLSRVIYGGRVSVVVGFSAAAIGMCAGLTLGVIAGHFRGRVERTFNFVMDTVLAFPPLVLLLAITAVVTPSIRSLIVSLSLLATPGFARVARANTIVFNNREFVDASRLLGAGHFRIIARDLLPNVITPVAGVAFLTVAALTVAEGSLSFLGFGVPPPTPSWGAMMSAGQGALSSDPHLVLVPSASLFLTVFSLNIVGDRVRARLDPRQAAL